jgi:recombinational DNA repair protein (RecF pathway)
MSHYEINVSKDGEHYFATDERSLRGTLEEAQTMARHFQKVFPKEEGYLVQLAYCMETQRTIEIDVPYDQFKRPMKCACCGTTKNLHEDFGSGGPYRCSSPNCIVF